LTYMSVFIIASTIFSIFWVNTAGMDAKSVADQFKSYSILIPGFRHDTRIVEKVLNRYIPALTILGGAFVGFLATFADLTSAIGTGTGILLTVMIVYQFYEQIMSQHKDDIPPSIRKFLGA
jgi:preprotein translocase subunit SecY